MSKSQLDMVKEFHVAVGNGIPQSPGMPPWDVIRRRAKLIMEESMETVGALMGIDEAETKEAIARMCEVIDDTEPKGNLPDIAKELNDLLYVTHGGVSDFGLPEKMFDAVHENNMTKVSGPRREDGKILKPPGYKKFDAAKFLAENGLPN